jgi:hypothetical protein
MYDLGLFEVGVLMITGTTATFGAIQTVIAIYRLIIGR